MIHVIVRGQLPDQKTCDCYLARSVTTLKESYRIDPAPPIWTGSSSTGDVLFAVGRTHHGKVIFFEDSLVLQYLSDSLVVSEGVIGHRHPGDWLRVNPFPFDSGVSYIANEPLQGIDKNGFTDLWFIRLALLYRPTDPYLYDAGGPVISEIMISKDQGVLYVRFRGRICVRRDLRKRVLGVFRKFALTSE